MPNFHGNSLPKTSQERRRNITIRVDLSLKMSRQLALCEGFGTEFIKILNVFPLVHLTKTIDRVLTIQNH